MTVDTLKSVGRGGAARAEPRFAPAVHSVLRERQIAACRVVFALLALVVVLFGAPGVPGHVIPLDSLMAGFLLYAGLFLLWTWRAARIGKRVPAVAHALDLGVFAAFSFIQVEAGGLWLVFLVFVLTAAAVRWHRQGALWTTLGALGIFLLSSIRPGATAWLVVPDTAGVLSTAILVLIVGVLLAFLSEHEERMRQRASLLLGWPATMHADRVELMQSLLSHVARALGVGRTLLVWDDTDEPWTWIANWEGGRVALERSTAEEVGPLAPEALQDQAFIVIDGGDVPWNGEVVTLGGRIACADCPLPATIRRLCSGRPVLSIPIRGETLEGRLFVPDPLNLSADELVMGDLLGRQLAFRLDQQGMFDRLRQGALMNERLRIAQDLHDGVIQSLAAASLKLESARQLLRDRPESAGRIIRDVQDLLVTEQRELREIVGTVGPEASSATMGGSEPGFGARLGVLVDRVATYWNMEVVLNDRFDETATASGRGHQVCCLVQEALVNASRHGRATRVAIDLECDDSELRLKVADDGSGFPFKGALDMAALRSSGLGPQSLIHRLLGLGGSMEITSSADGATLNMRFPRTRPGSEYPAFGPVGPVESVQRDALQHKPRA